MAPLFKEKAGLLEKKRAFGNPTGGENVHTKIENERGKNLRNVCNERGERPDQAAFCGLSGSRRKRDELLAEGAGQAVERATRDASCVLFSGPAVEWMPALPLFWDAKREA